MTWRGQAPRPETAHDLAHMLERIGRGDEAQVIFRDEVARSPDGRNLRCSAPACCTSASVPRPAESCRARPPHTAR